MKMSIIVGVLHMILGIILKGFNAIEFKDAPTFIFEFIP
jgi:V-type H+-transporting ATPase subunit a